MLNQYSTFVSNATLARIPMSAQQKKYPFDFKTQYGLGFNQQDDEIVVDFFFCGDGCSNLYS